MNHRPRRHLVTCSSARSLLKQPSVDRTTCSELRSHATVRDTRYHTAILDRVLKLDYSASKRVLVPYRGSLEISSRQLSENISLGCGTILGVKQPSFENRFRGCVILCHLRYSVGPWCGTCCSFFPSFSPHEDREKEAKIRAEAAPGGSCINRSGHVVRSDAA